MDKVFAFFFMLVLLGLSRSHLAHTLCDWCMITIFCDTSLEKLNNYRLISIDHRLRKGRFPVANEAMVPVELPKQVCRYQC